MEGNRPECLGIGTQARFIRLRDGSIGVDRIFRLDQMDSVANYLSRKLGQPVGIPVANKSSSKKPAVKKESFDLPEEPRKRVMDFLTDDYLIYGCLPWNSSESPIIPPPR